MYKEIDCESRFLIVLSFSKILWIVFIIFYFLLIKILLGLLTLISYFIQNVSKYDNERYHSPMLRISDIGLQNTSRNEDYLYRCATPAPYIINKLYTVNILQITQRNLPSFSASIKAVSQSRATDCGAVSKWPRCRWDVKHNQPTNQQKSPVAPLHI